MLRCESRKQCQSVLRVRIRAEVDDGGSEVGEKRCEPSCSYKECLHSCLSLPLGQGEGGGGVSSGVVGLTPSLSVFALSITNKLGRDFDHNAISSFDPRLWSQYLRVLTRSRQISRSCSLAGTWHM